MMEIPVTFRSERQPVAGVLHLPARRRPRVPAVLFLHGFTGTRVEFRRSFVRLARALAQTGAASLRFDFRGSGESAGDFSTLTPSSELADARAALRFLQRQPRVDPARIGVLGMSLGGMLAVHLLAGQAPVRAAVLWSPVADPALLLRRRWHPAADTQLREMGCVDAGGWALGRAFVEEMRTWRPLEAAAGVACPTLLVQGDQDQAVPPASACAYAAAFRRGGRELALHFVPGAGHTYESLRAEAELFGITLDWFREHLTPGSPHDGD